MFISYQMVRNSVIAVGLAIALRCGSHLLFIPWPTEYTVLNVSQNTSTPHLFYKSISDPAHNYYTDNSWTYGVTEAAALPPPALSSNEPSSIQVSENESQNLAESTQPLVDWEAMLSQNSIKSSALLASAMKAANARAAPGLGKDILGPKSPWKLNLYDDNSDGQWDRAKLDMNRDGVDDEKWNFKKGRWEKEGGNEIWNGERWVVAEVDSGSSPNISSSKNSTAEDPLSQYRTAMKIAGAKATGAQEKDVLGAESKWKLNLYDDNRDGQWDRAKLDTNRDGVDDEKWNFKKGRWEKDGGAKVWNGTDWTDA